MTDLNSLMIFAKVVEARSFSSAARLLKIPTSTVSRRVADLEKQLGVRLIERSTRNLRLTDVGAEASGCAPIVGRHASIIVLLDFRSCLNSANDPTKASLLHAGQRRKRSSACLWTTLEN
jgi:hypothetical protein